MNGINTAKGSLESLTEGQVLLTSVRKVAGNKIQLEFAEIIPNGRGIDPLAALNASDARFTPQKPRRAWLTAEPADAQMATGIDFSDANPGWTVNSDGQEVLPLDILNPVAKIGDKEHKFRVRIVETVTPTEWQAANLDKAAKRRGAEGAFITHKGMYIFANTTVVFNEAQHVFLTPDAVSENSTAAGGILAASGVSSGLPGEIAN